MPRKVDMILSNDWPLAGMRKLHLNANRKYAIWEALTTTSHILHKSPSIKVVGTMNMQNCGWHCNSGRSALSPKMMKNRRPRELVAVAITLSGCAIFGKSIA